MNGARAGPGALGPGKGLVCTTSGRSEALGKDTQAVTANGAKALLVRLWKDPEVPLARTALRSLSYWAQGQPILAHPNTRILGLKNIHIDGRLTLGLTHVGFLHDGDRTYVNIYDRGRLDVRGSVAIARGCRLDISRGACCLLDSCTINGRTRLLVSHGLEIGAGTIISWDCEFLDDDWHEVDYPGKRPAGDPRIVIGKNVLIGAQCRILKGVHLGDGTVVAAASVVTHSFGPGLLIGGNPARVLREAVTWR